MESTLKHRFGRGDTLALLILAVLTLILFARFFIPQPTYLLPNSVLGTDLDREIAPLADFMGDHWRAYRQLPTWRPYMMSGLPLLGSPLNPSLYPGQWIAALLPLPLGLNIAAVLHVILSGAGMYAILRFLSGLRRESALIGAILFAFAPRMMAHIAGGHWWLISGWAWFTWIYFFFTAYYVTRRKRYAALLGVAFAALLMNNINYVPMWMVALAPCTLAYLVTYRNFKRWLITSVIGWSTVGMVTFVLTAYMLIPAVNMLPYSSRFTALSAADIQASLPLSLLIGYFFPFKLRYTEAFLFAGIGLTLLPLIGLAGKWTRGERLWAMSGFAALLLSFGTNGLLYPLLYIVPGFSLLRFPERYYPFALIAFTALAAFGIDKWLNNATFSRWVRPLVTAISLLYLAFLAIEIAQPNLLPFYTFPHAILLPIAAIILLIPMTRLKVKTKAVLLAVVLIVDVWWADVSLSVPASPREVTQEDNPIVVFLRENTGEDERVFSPYGGVSDFALYNAGLNAADGYNTAQLAGYAGYINIASGCDFKGYSVGAPATRASADAVRVCPELRPNIPLLRLLNVRFIVLPAERAGQMSFEPVLTDGDLQVYDIGEGYGRLTAIPTANVRVVSAEECLSVLATIDPSREALVEETIPDGVFALNENVELRVIDSTRTATGETFNIEVLTGDALLVRSEAWSPYNRVSDGERTFEVIRVNCALQGVLLPSTADQRIEFQFNAYGL